MSFCLDDGSELLFGPANDNEPQTAILSEPPALAGGKFAGENPTRPFVHTTAEAEPRSNLDDESERRSHSAHRAAEPQKSFDKRLLLAPLALAVIVLGGFFGYRYFTPAKQASAETDESVGVSFEVDEFDIRLISHSDK